jgi:hypothetical protein
MARLGFGAFWIAKIMRARPAVSVAKIARCLPQAVALLGGIGLGLALPTLDRRWRGR